MTRRDVPAAWPGPVLLRHECGASVAELYASQETREDHERLLGYLHREGGVARDWPFEDGQWDVTFERCLITMHGATHRMSPFAEREPRFPGVSVEWFGGDEGHPRVVVSCRCGKRVPLKRDTVAKAYIEAADRRQSTITLTANGLR